MNLFSSNIYFSFFFTFISGLVFVHCAFISISTITDVKAEQWKYMAGQKHISGLPRKSKPGPGYIVQAQFTDSVAMKLIKMAEHTLWFMKVVWVNMDEISQLWEKAENISFSLSIKNLWSK